jgi:hypothetical protein
MPVRTPGDGCRHGTGQPELHRERLELLAVASPPRCQEELDRSTSGEWTARQVAHHMGDSEMVSAIRLRSF